MFNYFFFSFVHNKMNHPALLELRLHDIVEWDHSYNDYKDGKCTTDLPTNIISDIIPPKTIT